MHGGLWHCRGDGEEEGKGKGEWSKEGGRMGMERGITSEEREMGFDGCGARIEEG